MNLLKMEKRGRGRKVTTNKDKLLLAKFTPHSDWPAVRRAHLRRYNVCTVCGTRKKLAAHHIRPIQWYPELELEPENLITLCEGPANHHLFVGHLMDWKSYNVNVVAEAKWWQMRIRNRPKWKPF